MKGFWRRGVRTRMALSTVVLAAACTGDAPVKGAGESAAVRTQQTPAESRKPAAVDTIQARLAAAVRSEIQPRAGTGSQVVVLLIREGDVFTCEDLGRQSRELRNWAAELGLPFMVWAEADPDTRMPVFLRREHIPEAAVFLTRATFTVETGSPIRSPAAMLVNPATGEIRGFAHPERVANVRQRSFAQELGEIYRS